ncbi:ATP-dependent DNA helicase RecG [Moraxella lincolnii]|uniref:ATP-dependent DNA helicase RecG n=1 Tax=Lwoffella lincolnii TaxID=90241 RepID=UPI0030CE054C
MVEWFDVIDKPVTALTGVGSQVAQQLADLGIHRLFDLLLHLPRDYEDRSRLCAIDGVRSGQSVLVEGTILYVSNNQRGMTVILADASGQLQLRFFKVYRGLTQTMQVGNRLRVFGEVKMSRYGTQMHHPEYTEVVIGSPLPQIGPQPIYPTVKGLHQNKLRTLMRLALATWESQAKNQSQMLNLFTDERVGMDMAQHSQHHGLFDLSLFEALTLLHTPPIYANIGHQQRLLSQIRERTHPACQRLILEELTAHQLSLLQRREQLHTHKAPKCQFHSPSADALIQMLPYLLTSAQQRVVSEIVNDLTTSVPMLRLLQGDVGAGKTLVAALSACHAIDSGWQVAMMAPTEILAEQHFNNFKGWFEPLGIGVGWLAGKQGSKERQQMRQAMVDNDVQIVVGTHALFQQQVSFAKLGLVIIDEQHRFGVEQRKALTDKGVMGSTPHQLVMTATPIPRTLAMSAYGDMDTSIIDELPPGRTPVTTVTIDRNRRDAVIERIAANCAKGKQAYWVCPLVEESTALDAQAAQATYADLCERLDIRIGLVHGKMKAVEKQAVMQAFKAGQLDLLVATTVIEVGVDVPNASLMVIENAERLGLSQLHQLRGRVGRGSQKSFCVLLYQMPLSATGIERLNVLRGSNDGFVIAQKDLQIRGPGELLGKRQTGNVGYYVADLTRDETLLTLATQLAKRLLANKDNHPAIIKLIERWIPKASRFGHV